MQLFVSSLLLQVLSSKCVKDEISELLRLQDQKCTRLCISVCVCVRVLASESILWSVKMMRKGRR